MSISTAKKNNLNKMNRAAKDVSLGTMLQKLDANAIVTASAVVVTSAQASASAVEILTGRTGLIGHIVRWDRSGSPLAPVKVVNSGSNLMVTSACAAWYVFAANTDVVSWIAF